MGVAVVRRYMTATLLIGAALATTGAAPEEEAMIAAFDRVSVSYTHLTLPTKRIV